MCGAVEADAHPQNVCGSAAGVQPHASVAPERPGCMLALGSSDTFKRPAVLTGGPSHAALRTLCV